MCKLYLIFEHWKKNDIRITPAFTGFCLPANNNNNTGYTYQENKSREIFVRNDILQAKI